MFFKSFKTELDFQKKMVPERKMKSGSASSKVKKMCGDTGSKDVARLNV